MTTSTARRSTTRRPRPTTPSPRSRRGSTPGKAKLDVRRRPRLPASRSSRHSTSPSRRRCWSSRRPASSASGSRRRRRGRSTSTTTCTSASASAATCWRCPPSIRTLGTAFYTLDQEPAERPRFTRQTDNCLICHASSPTRGVPGPPRPVGVHRPRRAADPLGRHVPHRPHQPVRGALGRVVRHRHARQADAPWATGVVPNKRDRRRRGRQRRPGRTSPT